MVLSFPTLGLCASVTPSLLELESQPNKLIESSISVLNPDVVDQTYYLDTLMFRADDETGSPKFISKEEEFSGLATWISFPSRSVVVPAKSKGDVPFNIFVPDTTKPGGYYAAITVSNAPEDIVATNGAIIDAKTAVLVLLSVGGGSQVVSAQILDFVESIETDFQSSFSDEFEYRIQNQGNVHILPTGKIELKDVFGRTVASTDANPTQGRVLPGSTRTYLAETKDPGHYWIEVISEQMNNLAIGPISATLSLTYSDGKQLTEQIDAFWYVPWQILTTLFGTLIVLLFVYGLGRKKPRK